MCTGKWRAGIQVAAAADARFGLMFDLSGVAVLPAVQSWHVV
jgi:hypothetical protein